MITCTITPCAMKKGEGREVLVLSPLSEFRAAMITVGVDTKKHTNNRGEL